MMSDGSERPIETISVGDRVLSRQGNVCTVSDAYSRGNADELITFRCGSASSDVSVTPNHRFWGIKGSRVSHLWPKDGAWEHTENRVSAGWIEAGHLSPGDYIEVPTFGEVRDNETFDEGYCRLIGFYLAEGSSSGRDGKLHHADFTLHRNEEDIANEIVSESQRLFGKGVHVLSKAVGRENVRGVALYSVHAAETLVDLCGKGAHHKRLREDILLLPAKKQRHILLAWLLGDGHTTTRRGWCSASPARRTC